MASAGSAPLALPSPVSKCQSVNQSVKLVSQSVCLSACVACEV
jgi:hypothetical protein